MSYQEVYYKKILKYKFEKICQGQNKYNKKHLERIRQLTRAKKSNT